MTPPGPTARRGCPRTPDRVVATPAKLRPRTHVLGALGHAGWVSHASGLAAAMLSAAFLACCGGGSTMTETAERWFDSDADGTAELCVSIAQTASSRDELLQELEGLTRPERAAVRAALGGPGMPYGAGDWSWSQVREFHAAAWDECSERRGR